MSRRVPKVYYGWVLALVLGVTTTTSWGILFYAFSVLLEPMEAELGWSRGATTGAFSLALLISGVSAVPVGWWLDRHGPRLLMTLGSCAGVALTLAWSSVQDLTMFYLIWSAIGVTMAAALYNPAFATMAVWFRARRSQALTIITLMGALASTIFIPLTAWLVQGVGWRPALVILAAILAIVTLPAHALLLRRRPRDLGLAPDGGPLEASAQPDRELAREASISVREALTDPKFAGLVIAFCLHAFASVGLSIHMVAYLVDGGFEVTSAAMFTGVIGAMQVAGRLLFVIAERWLPPRVVSGTIFVAQPVAITALALLPAPVGVPAFVALFGMGRGAATLLRPIVVAGLYGPARFGSIAGVLALFTTAAEAAGPFAVGLAYDGIKSYAPILWALTGVALLAAVAITLADRRTR